MTMAEPADGFGGPGENGGATPAGAGLDESTMGDGAGAPGRGYARAQARSRMDAMSGRVREKADELKGQASERVDEATTRMGGRIGGIARAIRRAGEELRGDGDERLASLTDELAGQVERMGSYLEEENPGRMLQDLERMAKGNPALFVGGTFAVGMLLGRFLRADEPDADVDIVFEPEGDWAKEGMEGAGGEMAMDFSDSDFDGSDEGPYDIGGDAVRAMTPDIENVSDAHPSSPPPETGRAHETPVRTPIAGRETMGPGVRTGSSGAAALDAGSAGPRPGTSWGDVRRGDGGTGSGEQGGNER
jgi:hypothetical protein